MPELYEEIASLYHLVYDNWDEAINRQASQLDAVFQRFLDRRPLAILDVSCGIGTQTLGLAALGHHVTASDISPASVERAKREAKQRSLSIDFEIGDMRSCGSLHASEFDVVLSADNSVPHLLRDDQILEAFRNFHQCLRPGGLALVSVRDYRAEKDRSSPQLLPYGFRMHGLARYFVVQTRDWAGDFYDVTMYFIRESRENQAPTVVAGSSRYYAVTTDRLESLFREAGFENVQRLDQVFFQPMVLAKRATG